MIIENGRANNDQSFETHIAEFLVVQRNVGYANNDGLWTVNQLPDLYWDAYGYLTKRREGKFLGAYASAEEAYEAIVGAERMPELKRHKILSR